MSTPLNQLNGPMDAPGATGGAPDLFEQVAQQVDNPNAVGGGENGSGAQVIENMRDMDSFSDVSATSDNEEIIRSAMNNSPVPMAKSYGGSSSISYMTDIKQAIMVTFLYIFFQSGIVNSIILSGPKLIALFGEGETGHLSLRGMFFKAFLFGVVFFLGKLSIQTMF